MAVDEKTVEYVRGSLLRPERTGVVQPGPGWTSLAIQMRTLIMKLCRRHLDRTTVSWGQTLRWSPSGHVPDPKLDDDPIRRSAIERALKYMGLEPNQPIESIHLDRVFIGSCTNSRIEDLREAARVVDGKRVADSVIQAMVVPGSGLVKEQAEEGLDVVFRGWI